MQTENKTNNSDTVNTGMQGITPGKWKVNEISRFLNGEVPPFLILNEFDVEIASVTDEYLEYANVDNAYQVTKANAQAIASLPEIIKDNASLRQSNDELVNMCAKLIGCIALLRPLMITHVDNKEETKELINTIVKDAEILLPNTKASKAITTY